MVKTCAWGLWTRFLLAALVLANAVSCVGPRNKIGHPARHRNQLTQVPVLIECEPVWPSGKALGW